MYGIRFNSVPSYRHSQIESAADFIVRCSEMDAALVVKWLLSICDSDSNYNSMVLPEHRSYFNQEGLCQVLNISFRVVGFMLALIGLYILPGKKGIPYPALFCTSKLSAIRGH